MRKAFTLAEVLITLIVIGVIASITVPALMTNIQDAQFKIVWRKTYSDFAQATSKLLIDNSGTLENLCGTNDSSCLRDKYLPYLSYVRSCITSQFVGNCWHRNGVTKFLDGTFEDRSSGPGAVLNNGQLVRFEYITPLCNSANGNIFRCGGILVDVNGFKDPNTVGRDIFEIYILKDRIKAKGTVGDSFEDDCQTNPPSGNGWGCSARYLMQ